MSSLAALLLSAVTTSGPFAPPPRAQTPRLVVLVAVDQLIPEQLDRLTPLLEGGLGRFWQRGTVYRAAALEYAATETAPGHATFATGCRPATHGIVGNSFFDRSQGRSLYSVSDPGARKVTAAGAANSGVSVGPANLRVPGLGDHLAAAFPGSLTFAVSFKDRAAVAMGGRDPHLVLWWDRRAGGFASSTRYVETLPDFVLDWNDGWLDVAAGWRWEPSFEGDPSRYGTDADEREGEVPYGRFGVSFPYELPSMAGADVEGLRRQLAPRIYGVPLGDRFTVEMARRAVDELGLGADDAPDLLALSLSGCDVVGHANGPYSWEVTDLILRADRALGELFDHLDARVGEGRWIAALSADHGVLELPEALAARGVGARRVGRGEVGAMRGLVREALALVYPDDGELAVGFTGKGFTLDEAALRAAGLDPGDVRAIIAQAAAEAPHVAAAYTLEQLAGAGPGDGFLPLYRQGFDPQRSEDVLLRQGPWLLAMPKGTSHGSPYPYDRRVPLALLGAPFPAQRRYDAADSMDAVPTLLEALGIAVPEGLDGRVLPRD